MESFNSKLSNIILRCTYIGVLIAYGSSLLFAGSDADTFRIQYSAGKKPLLECLAETESIQTANRKLVKTLQNQNPGSLKLARIESQRINQCQLSIHDLEKSRPTPNPVFIDVRRATDFKKYHIPGSLNLPGKKIITKRQWKHKGIVLISRGDSYAMIDQLCLDLIQAGFRNVFVLEGGIRSWQAQGGELLGTSPDSIGIAAISPQDFFSESTYNHWLLVTSDAEVLNTDTDLRHQYIVISPEKINAALLLKNKYGDFKESINSNPFILIIEDDSHRRDSLLKIAQETSDLSFYLDGGVTALHAHLKKQQIIWNYKPHKKGGVLCGQ